MKKINLTIAEPCHENWDQMTQTDKGKFCSSCQKTVIDFTNMSDRQLAEFFKKPKDNVCGRFYNDQLERPIDIQKKRLPWIKYFFQFTWPAFLFFLKSCTDRGQTMGEPILKKVEQKFEAPPIPTTVGGISFTEESSKEITTVGMTEPIITEDVKVEIKCDEAECMLPEEMNITDIEDEPIKETDPLENITLVCNKNITLGGVRSITYYSVATVNPPVTENINTMNETESKGEFKIYPNPVKTGSMVTIQFPENNIPGEVQIISSTGQLIALINQTEKDYATMCNIRIPDNVSSGLYFIRLTGSGKILQTSKLVITK